MNLRERLRHLELAPPPDAAVITELRGFAGQLLPTEYFDLLSDANGGEGWASVGYVVLWPAEQIGPLNIAYQTMEYAPGFLIFGSNGGGEAYAFELRRRPQQVVQMPFVGLSPTRAELIAPSFEAFVELLARPRPGDGPRQRESAIRGLELCEVKPILFGGDPVDLENKAWLPRKEHIQYVRFWNRIARETEGKLPR